MSLPDKCPFCDAGPGEYVNNYLCGTFIRPNVASRVHQTKVCLVSERTRLAARVAELEAENKGLRDRFSDADTERNAAQAALKAAFARVAELEARCKRLEEALDTLTLVVGLTPIAGNKEALQEALDLARAELKAKEAKP